MRIFGRKSRTHWPRRIAVAGIFVTLFWLIGLFRFVAEIPRASPPADHAADAIVVLTGGGGRLPAGIELLAAGKGKKLFVSGVYRGVDVQELLLVGQRAPGDLECCIVLGYSAGNTRGNAQETARWMTGERYRSMWLVTANYHMQRSLLEFGRAMPETEIAPYPVAQANVILDAWWLWPGTARLIMWEYCKYLVALALFWLPG